MEDPSLTSLQGRHSWGEGSAVEALQASAASPGFREAILPRGLPRLVDLALSEFYPPSVEGCRGLAQHTLVHTGPTVAPGPMMGTAWSSGRRRIVMGPKCPAGPRHVEGSCCVSATPEVMGDVGGPTTHW